MASFIPYQVDYSVQNAAKTLGFSKKRISFKFGFANQSSLSQGLTGPACRGSEHELVFVWSLKTGKRQLLFDNKNLHFSESGMNGWTQDRTFQHVFHFRDNATRANIKATFTSQPVTQNSTQGTRPFNLSIGGISYFDFNQIYLLGTDGMIRGHQNRSESPMNAEERKQLAAAKLASLQDLASSPKRQEQTSLQREEPALISFDDPPPVPVAQPPPPMTQQASSITLDPAIEESRQPGANVYGSNPYAVPPPVSSTFNPYAVPPPAAPSTTALAPYGGTPAPYAQQYVDATGRVNVGVPPPPSPYANNPYNLASPGNASYGSVSYGSAPSFAQPPPQPQYQQPRPPPTSYPPFNPAY